MRSRLIGSWIVASLLLTMGCAMGYIPITKEKSGWYLMVGTKVKTDAITVDALPELPQSLISIGALGAAK